MKKIVRFVLFATAAVVALFFMLAIALYIPPVQNYVVRKVTDRVSEQTGMTLRVERVRLAFPLDLALIGAFASQGGDTVLDVSSVRVGVAVMPLLKKQIDVDGLVLKNGKINTLGLISNTQIKGRVGTLSIESRGVDLNRQTVRVNDALLRDTHLSVLLCDTAAKDTSTSKTEWRITVDRFTAANSSVRLRMPGDSMRIAATLGRVLVKDGDFDLGRGSYGVKRLEMSDCAADYDIPYAAYGKGFDVNHISVTDLNARVGDILYRDGAISASVGTLGVKERGGLEVNKLHGNFFADSTKVALKGFELHTAHSTLTAGATVSMAALKRGGKGRVDVQLDGNIDRRDVLTAIPGGLTDSLQQLLPSSNLRVSALLGGSGGRLTLQRAKLRADGVFALDASGTLDYMTEPARRGNLKYSLKLLNLDFAKAFIGRGIDIPRGTSARGTLAFAGNRYSTNSVITAGGGSVSVNGSYDTGRESYSAKINAVHFPLGTILAGSTMRDLTARMSVNGRGFDPFSPATHVSATAAVEKFGIGDNDLSNINLNALLKSGAGTVDFDFENELLGGRGTVNAQFTKKDMTANLVAGLSRINIGKMSGKTDTLHLSTRLTADLHANSAFTDYGTRARFDSIRIITAKATYPAKDLLVNFDNRSDSLFASLGAGDFTMRLTAGENLDGVLAGVTGLTTLITKQIENKRLDQNELRELFPNLCLYVEAGQQNPVSNIFRYLSGYKFNNLLLDIDASPDEGINGRGHIYAFNTGTLLLDTIGIKMFQDSAGMKIKGVVHNATKHNPHIFKADVSGFLYNDGVGAELVYLDKNNKRGMNVGVRANLVDSGVSVHIYPENPVIAYRNFKVNKNNFITLTDKKNIFADVNLLADDGTGLKIYTTDNDASNDVTMTINHVNLKELTATLPYAPNMSGFLSGDFHMLREDSVLTAAYAIRVDDMNYENAPLGNLGIEGTYMPTDDYAAHNINAFVTRDDREIASVEGAYFGREDSVVAAMELLDFPVDMLNGFTGDVFGLKGNLDGTLDVTGHAAKPVFNGMVKLDAVSLYSDIYGFNFNVQNDSARITNSNLVMKDLRFFSTGKNPLVINGGVDFSNFDNVTLKIDVKAKNFELVDAAQTKKSQVFGKVFSDINATVSGTVSDMHIRGGLGILSNTNVSYVLQDSPLSVDNRLNELVSFVDFADSTRTEASPLESGGVDMILSINISDAARLHCDISGDKQSYVDIEGGGELMFRYSPQGEITLTGRYTATSGEMKYALPVIPLRTFHLTGGSYIEFTGDPMNPTLNIQAKERLKASVTENNVSRSVAFDAGISITQPLSRMGLEFTIEAPDDQAVKNQLASMSAEQRNKLAVSMLATGLYLEESNTANGFRANNALNAFLQSEVQQIAGNALKTIDLSVSVEDGTSETGEANTDYSFRFAKRFWGNRVNVVIGGRVSTGNDARNDAASFIDNISLEYRLDNSASRYVRLFYDNNMQDPLEGLLTEMGAGLVLRRKTTTFGEIFFIKPRKEKSAPAPGSAADQAAAAKKRKRSDKRH